MLKRRRFLTITAGCGMAGLQAGLPAQAAPVPVVWRGVALGALASMQLVHPDRAHARALLDQCLAEIERLEAIFSLYRPDSALSRLNAAGELAGPPVELVELLSFALALARASDGAFDPSVQPLLQLYYAHFSQAGAAAGGPAAARVRAALARVGFEQVEVGSARIRLARPGAALTLNGVAQGYITDRVAGLLRAGGLADLLLDLGEGRASGRRADGQPWRAAISDPANPSRALFELALGSDGGLLPALATSGGYGSPFGADPRLHHLLDPRSGRSANQHASVTVAAPSATLADGLSTALSVLPAERGAALLARHPGARAWLVDARGRVTQRGAALPT